MNKALKIRVNHDAIEDTYLFGPTNTNAYYLITDIATKKTKLCIELEIEAEEVFKNEKDDNSAYLFVSDTTSNVLPFAINKALLTFTTDIKNTTLDLKFTLDGKIKDTVGGKLPGTVGEEADVKLEGL